MSGANAVAGMIVAALAPRVAIDVIAICHAVAFIVLLWLSRRVDAGTERAEPTSVWSDLREGVSFTVRTPWLFWTLMWAVVIVSLFIGPFEVLTSYVMRDQLGLGADFFGALLAIFGTSSAIAALVMGSSRMPRRYPTVMMASWGPALIPLATFGIATEFWQLAVSAAIIGAGGGIGQVIWGTLLQRRVPRHVLGRVSRLDFFVSLSLMPVSIAVAGVIASAIPTSLIFAVAGIVPVFVTLIAYLAGGMHRDEVAHPLLDDNPPETIAPHDTADVAS